METRWWSRVPCDLTELIDRFAVDPHAAEFAPIHQIGYLYDKRTDSRGSVTLPEWVTKADALRELSYAYQRPLDHFERLNPEISDCDAALKAGTEVRVPDPEFPPLLASWLAAQVLADPILTRVESVGLMQRLLPIAVANPTALDTVLGRLLLANSPSR